MQNEITYILTSYIILKYMVICLQLANRAISDFVFYITNYANSCTEHLPRQTALTILISNVLVTKVHSNSMKYLNYNTSF